MQLLDGNIQSLESEAHHLTQCMDAGVRAPGRSKNRRLPGKRINRRAQGALDGWGGRLGLPAVIARALVLEHQLDVHTRSGVGVHVHCLAKVNALVHRSTSSTRTISAPSPWRGPIFKTRVYPPGRSAMRGMSLVKSLSVTSPSSTTAATARRAATLSRLAVVMTRSTQRRSSLPLASVVSMRPWSSRAVTRFRLIALRCSIVRPNFRPAFWCRMSRLDQDLGQLFRRQETALHELLFYFVQ